MIVLSKIVSYNAARYNVKQQALRKCKTDKENKMIRKK